MENTINQRIKDLIHAKRMTKNSFAAKVGLSSQTIYNIVDGRLNKPSFEVLDKIITTFDDISPSWLMTGEGEMYKNGGSAPLLSKPADNGQYGQLVTDMLREQLKRAYDEIEFLREIIRKADLGKLEVQTLQTALEDLPFIFGQKESNADAPVTL